MTNKHQQFSLFWDFYNVLHFELLDPQSQTVQTYCTGMSPDRNIKRFMHPPAPAPALQLQTTDLKSNQVQNYHRTYIIQIMDIRAYFLSLLLDRLDTRTPLASFLFIGRTGQSEESYRQRVCVLGSHKETTNLGSSSLNASSEYLILIKEFWLNIKLD